MDETTPEGRANGTAAPGQMSSTIWIQSDQLDQLHAIRRYLAKPDQPGWPSLADAFVFAVGLTARAIEKVESRRRGDD